MACSLHNLTIHQLSLIPKIKMVRLEDSSEATGKNLAYNLNSHCES